MVLKHIVNDALGTLGYKITRTGVGGSEFHNQALSRTVIEGGFHSLHYLRINHRRLEHLASLGLPLAGKSVLEVGAGIGDLSTFFIDRGCDMTITEARADNLAFIRDRFPKARVDHLDLEQPAKLDKPFDVVFCYGLLYHLGKPEVALEFMAQRTGGLLLMETCVSPGDDLSPQLVAEKAADRTQAVSGTGCRPTRAWIVAELKKYLPHVYLPTTQPWHEEFPTSWTAAKAAPTGTNTRAVFIASSRPIHNPMLREEIPQEQSHHP